MVSNKQEVNSVTFPSTHTHLFSVGFFKNDIGSFFFFVLTLSPPDRGIFIGFDSVIECYEDDNSNVAPDSLLPM